MAMPLGVTFHNEVRLKFILPIGKNDEIELGYGVTAGFNAICPPNAQLNVTRTGDESWLYETDTSARACLVEERGGNNNTYHGIYTMPLSFTVTIEH